MQTHKDALFFICATIRPGLMQGGFVRSPEDILDELLVCCILHPRACCTSRRCLPSFLALPAIAERPGSVAAPDTTPEKFLVISRSVVLAPCRASLDGGTV